jgi:hypothetical protein
MSHDIRPISQYVAAGRGYPQPGISMDLSKVEILSNAVFRMGMMNIYEN